MCAVAERGDSDPGRGRRQEQYPGGALTRPGWECGKENIVNRLLEKPYGNVNNHGRIASHWDACCPSGPAGVSDRAERQCRRAGSASAACYPASDRWGAAEAVAPVGRGVRRTGPSQHPPEPLLKAQVVRAL